MLKTPQKAIVDALKLQGIHSVQIQFYGGGDEGHLDSIFYHIDGNVAPNFKDVGISYVQTNVDWSSGVSVSSTVSKKLSEAISEVTEAQLMATGVDWWNNEGGSSFFKIDLLNNAFEFNVDVNTMKEEEQYTSEISIDKWLADDVIASDGLVGIRQTVFDALKAQKVAKVSVKYSAYDGNRDMGYMGFLNRRGNEKKIKDVVLRYLDVETAINDVKTTVIVEKPLTEAIQDACLSQADDTGVNWTEDNGGGMAWELNLTKKLNSLGIEVKFEDSESAHFEESTLAEWVALEDEILKQSGLTKAIEEMAVCA